MAGRLAILAALAAAVGVAAMGGCRGPGGATGAEPEQRRGSGANAGQRRAEVKDHLRTVTQTRRIDAATEDYMRMCLESRDFRLRARMGPLLLQAVKVGAMAPAAAIQKVAALQASATGTDERKYWGSVKARLEGASPRLPGGA